MVSSKGAGNLKPSLIAQRSKVILDAKICDGRREIKLNLERNLVGPTDPEGTRLDLWISETPKVSARERCPVLARGSEPMPSTTAQRAHNVQPLVRP
eukprot:scaffold7039_cov117-Skeletonema_marinoi.AAC.1